MEKKYSFTKVKGDEKVQGKIWLLRSADLDRLPRNTTLYTLDGKIKVTERDEIDDINVWREDYLRYGLPCHTWSFADVWKILKRKDKNKQLARWTLQSSKTTPIEICELIEDPQVQKKIEHDNETPECLDTCCLFW